jgi:hypothetical protein
MSNPESGDFWVCCWHWTPAIFEKAVVEVLDIVDRAAVVILICISAKQLLTTTY